MSDQVKVSPEEIARRLAKLFLAKAGLLVPGLRDMDKVEELARRIGVPPGPLANLIDNIQASRD